MIVSKHDRTERAMAYDWDVRRRDKRKQKHNDDVQKEEAGDQPKQEDLVSQPQLLRKINVRWLLTSLLAVLLVGWIAGFLSGKGVPGFLGKGKATEQPRLAAGVSAKTPSPQPTHTFRPTYAPPPTQTPEPVPTATPYPTNTHYPTYTPPPTWTPSPTPSLTATRAPPTATATPSDLFSDDFTRSLEPEWEIVSGDWRVVDDELQSLSDGESCVMVGDQSWRNYAIEFDFKRRGGDQSIHVLMRVQDRNDLMAFRIESRSPGNWWHHCGWWIRKSGEWEKLVGTEAAGHAEAHVRIEVENEFYTCYIDGKRWSSFSDPTFSSGRVGLLISGSYATSFDDFRVVPLPE